METLEIPIYKYMNKMDKQKKDMTTFVPAQKDLKASFWEIEFTDYNGNNICLKNYKDKYILLNIRTTWCCACISEIPHIIKVIAKLLN